MTMIRSILLGIVRFIVASVCAFVILSVYTWECAYSGIHMYNINGSTDYTWMPNQRKAETMEGYAWNRMDINGFNNAYYKDSIDYLVIGSSHTEAINVPQNKNYVSLINQNSPEKFAYNIGISAHNVYVCVQNLRKAVEEYNPSENVILETSTVDLSILDMQRVIKEEYPELESYDSGLLFTLQKAIPLVKNIYKCVKNWKEMDENIELSEENETNNGINEEYRIVLSEFVKKIKSDATSGGAKVIVFYRPSVKIDEFGNLINNTDQEKLEMFKSACLENAVVFVDMSQDFFELYNSQKKLPYGFINTEVGRGHMNEYGHRCVANRLLQVMGGNMIESE